jgi:hypothetical protein
MRLFIYLLVVFHKLLLPNMRFTFKMCPGARYFHVRDCIICPNHEHRDYTVDKVIIQYSAIPLMLDTPAWGIVSHPMHLDGAVGPTKDPARTHSYHVGPQSGPRLVI